MKEGGLMMEQDLISKKDLLVETGISYGQLYRWKRKKLIPEEWFIRKSTFTGQETFFPKSEVIARIDKIKQMKDDWSLDEMADVFIEKNEPLPMFFSREFIIERNIVTEMTLEQFSKQAMISERFPFGKVCIFYVLEQMLKTGEINRSEGEMVYKTLEAHTSTLINKGGDFYFVRKMGVSFAMFVSPAGQLFFDSDVRVIAKYPMNNVIGELKGKLQRRKQHVE